MANSFCPYFRANQPGKPGVLFNILLPGELGKLRDASNDQQEKHSYDLLIGFWKRQAAQARSIRELVQTGDVSEETRKASVERLTYEPDDDEVGRKRTELLYEKLKAEAETREIKVADPSGIEHTYSSKCSVEDQIMLRKRVNSGEKKLPGEEKRLLDNWIATKQKDKPAEEKKKKDKPRGKYIELPRAQNRVLLP